MDYDDMLDRALDETPDIEGSSDRFDVPDPDVRQEGNVTVFENFQSTVDRLGRDDSAEPADTPESPDGRG